ncbi:LYS9, Saccharopine dehydrogenase, lysine biosynthesis pathway, partial [Chytriomyces sp. MP71]
ASNSAAEARSLSAGRPQAPTAHLDVSDANSLGKLVREHDVVVSFVPATLHPVVAEHCINEKKHLVTASYLSPAMKAFDARAKQHGLTFINEIGLDPGIDHLTAMRAFDEVKEKGGKITSFISWCGGLPAPEASNNPLGYKFSWSPRGVLLAGLNSAVFKRDGKIQTIEGKDLMRSAVGVPIYPGFALEGIPNRDSLGYLETYGLGDGSSLQNMFRGTLRYRGYTEMMGAFVELGLLDTAIRADIKTGMSWADLMTSTLGLTSIPQSETGWRDAVFKKLRPYPTADATGRLDRVMASLNWSMLSKDHAVAPSPSILDAFCALLQSKLVYAEGERDLVVMHHVFGVEWANGRSNEMTSTLIAYGDPNGYSAMAKTVGLPAAMATEMILDGTMRHTGVLAPVYKDIYEPMLEKLEGEGIKFVEETR